MHNFRYLFIIILLLSTSAAHSQTITILAYNIHHGEDVNGNVDLRQIADVIRKANADVVALEEVDSLTNRTGKIDQLQEIARLTGMQYFFGKNMDYDGGGYGVGILTKLPIKKTFVTRLPNFPGSEPRVAATAELTLANGRSLLFTAIHLDYVDNPAERIQQAKKLLEVFSKLHIPSVLAGDFNAQPEEETMKDLFFNLYADTDPTGVTPSFPSNDPNIKIDYILLSKKDRWNVKHFEVIDERIASDHRPVKAVVELQ